MAVREFIVDLFTGPANQCKFIHWSELDQYIIITFDTLCARRLVS